jgi:5-methylcytosine-specific restriction protein A
LQSKCPTTDTATAPAHSLAKTFRVCAKAGCPELTKESWCAEHKPRELKGKRPSSAQRGYDTRWQKFRATFLQSHPTCIVVGCTRDATDVDHIDNQGPHGPRGYDVTNLQALCHQHHSAKTAATTHASS